ncbi:protein JINGUBANG-like [Durio zibethinus]|uniref:Protein JINGUBANG-like n=1 Tax=Durio zibethinus TaxID=66656 RepID=A0A6P6BGJ5_DURZI|nr:protein JINGUBANG-like [Durio zibethinus]
MKVRSWLNTCSTSICATTTHDSTIPFPKNPSHSPEHLVSDSSSDNRGSATSSSASSNDTSYSSLHSNLSLLTLPSVPSLQKLFPETLGFSVSHISVTSIKPRPKQPITCVAVQGNLLYAASVNEINVYDRETSTLLDVYNSQDSSSGSVKSVTFCNEKIFTAHQDCKIRVWQMTMNKKHKFLIALPTFNDRLRRFILPKNYVYVRRHVKRLWIEHTDAVTGLAVNKGLIYSVSWDKTLKIWRASDVRCLQSIKAHDDAINAVTASADGTVYTGSADRRIRVWAKSSGEKCYALVATLEKHKSAVNALALNYDGSVLFSGACDRSILVWEREDSANYMAVTGALRGHGKAILSLINVFDLLMSGSADRTVRIWQRGVEGKYCCLAVLEGHQKPVKTLTAVKEDGNSDVVSVISGSLDGEIRTWKMSVSRTSSPSSTTDVPEWNL